MIAKWIALSPMSWEIFRYATGLGDYADVLGNSYNARFGIIPLVLKVVSLVEMKDIGIFMVG